MRSITMTNNNNNNDNDRVNIIEETLEPVRTPLMYHIQQYVVNEFTDKHYDDTLGHIYYINNEQDVHSAFNQYTHLGSDVIDDYIKENKCGLSMTDINEVLYEYKEIALDMDLDMEDNIGQMVNCIMFNIANSLGGVLEFE